MTLDAWFTANKTVGKSEFALRIGVSRQALDRYMRGIRTPRPKVMERIHAETGGTVSANDFMRVSNPSAPAAVGALAG